ncbi:unnamed protein product [Choristocarpus tenellus]
MVRKYASAQNILLTGTWGPFCRGCSLDKSHSHPTPKETDNRASVKGERVYVDLTGANVTSEEDVASFDDCTQEGTRRVDFAQDEAGGINLTHAEAKDVDLT